jgi:hypothetical protein
MCAALALDDDARNRALNYEKDTLAAATPQ